MEEEIRGFNLRVDNLRTQMREVINQSNLPPSVVMLILKDYYNEVNQLFINAANTEYNQFCETASEKLKQQENITEEEEEKDNTAAAQTSDAVENKTE